MDNNILAEAILKYVKDRQICHLLDIGDEFSVKGDFRSIDVKVAVDELLEKKFLVMMQTRKQSVRITDRGKKALQLGLKGYDDFIAEIKAEMRNGQFIRDVIISIIGALLGSIVSFLLI